MNTCNTIEQMVFLIDTWAGVSDVTVYDNLQQLSQTVEWQDIYEGFSVILDGTGTTYEWDNTRIAEYGTLYKYTLKPQGANPSLAARCNQVYMALGKPSEFQLKLK